LKDKLIDTKDFALISPVFKGEMGQRFARLVMKLFSIDLVNALYDRSRESTGTEFAESILKDLGVNYLIGNAERLQTLPKGAFITVSNHPYGGIDGIMLIDLMAGIRPNYKLMVNEVLSMVKPMEKNFIAVKPKVGEQNPDPSKNLYGIRETLSHIREGNPFGFFPAGAVSMFSFRNFLVRDREWQEGILRLIQSVNVPVVPIRFFDGNSPFFYFLGLIDWRVRMFRMPYELFNKDDRQIRIGIGKTVSVEEQAAFPTAKLLGAHLKQLIYDMPAPTSFQFRSDLNAKKIEY
jgi:putative hemolysin